MFRFAAAAAALMIATPAAMPAFAGGHLTASGDAAAGERAFRQCVSCHVVVDDAGETLAGRNARTGPNLFGIIGGKFGQMDFKYSDLVLAAGEGDTVVDEATFVAYVSDPTAYMQELTGQSGRSKMTFKVRKEEDAVNLYAYLKEVMGVED